MSARFDVSITSNSIFFNGFPPLSTKPILLYSKVVIKGDLVWKQLGAIDVSDNNSHALSYQDVPSPREFLISYGTKNETQSYGGGEISIPINENKPAFLPVYSQINSVYQEVAIVYVYNATGAKNIMFEIKSGTRTLRFIVWYR